VIYESESAKKKGSNVYDSEKVQKANKHDAKDKDGINYILKIGSTTF
jgi:hypothetical protein